MKRRTAPLVMAIGLLAGPGTGIATAAPTTPTDPSVQQFDCPGFVISAQVTGAEKVIPHSLHFAGSKPVTLFTNVAAASTLTLSRPAPAVKVFSSSINGTVRVAWDPGTADFIYKATGRNLITVPKHTGYPGGLFLTVGQVAWTLDGPVDPDGGLTGPGTVTDLCRLLAP